LTGLQDANSASLRGAAHWVSDRADDIGRDYVPRRGCVFAAVSSGAFLSRIDDQRRWLPLEVDRIDLEAIERDRELLYAEGALRWVAEGAEVDWRGAHELGPAARAVFRETAP